MIKRRLLMLNTEFEIGYPFVVELASDPRECFRITDDYDADLFTKWGEDAEYSVRPLHVRELAA